MSPGRLRPYLIVAAGAAVGAALRWAVSEVLPRRADEFPWATLGVNLVGCLLAGVALRWVTRNSIAWLGGVTGLLGGLTTFSTFSVEARQLVEAGRAGLAVAYVATSIIGGLVAIEAGRARQPRVRAS